MTLRQRQPRVEDAAHLAYVRTLACLVCHRPGPSDPAHLRSAAPQYGKPPTGLGEKPSDRWTLPLCRTHHDEQHKGAELSFWLRHGIPDPFAVAMALYASRPVVHARRAPKFQHTKPRKPRAERKPIISRVEWPQGRKLQSRGFPKAALKEE